MLQLRLLKASTRLRGTEPVSQIRDTGRSGVMWVLNYHTIFMNSGLRMQRGWMILADVGWLTPLYTETVTTSFEVVDPKP